ncbi:UDP-N-acetylmuramoyl-tripeptide--D-alanyl-D-alanine ligase [Candidatus Sumerlaeota bacterium]|nr:UDP-N-acetylmuramoyl-tripeptide--D-alanyl-D-alanine ligase [Candidatus Sumerlaeota bacterium]
MAEVLRVTGGTLVRGPSKRACRRLSTDTRSIRRGDWFVALVGEHFDGHDFLSQAVERGAASFVLSRLPSDFEVSARFCVVLVDDTLRALGAITAEWRRRIPVRVIGVTGSSGKTTTKDLLGAMMTAHAPTLVTKGNFNNLIGVPWQLQRLGPHHHWAVLEIGMNAPGEIDTLAAMIQPCIGLITNVGEAHSGMFPNGARGVFEAKAELIAHIEEGGALVLNADDGESTRELARRAERRGLRVVRFGMRPGRGVDLWVEAVRPFGLGGHRVTLADATGRVEVALTVFGRCNVANLAAAAAAARTAGVPLEAIPAGMLRFRPSRLRSRVQRLGRVAVLVDCYNANPQSMAEALSALGEIRAEGKKIAVLGDMFELGKGSAAAHRRMGRAVLAAGVDHLVTFGKEARRIAEGAKGVDSRHFDSPQACAAHIQRMLRAGDVVLIKGSRAMAMERILDSLREVRRR